MDRSRNSNGRMDGTITVKTSKWKEDGKGSRSSTGGGGKVTDPKKSCQSVEVSIEILREQIMGMRTKLSQDTTSTIGEGISMMNKRLEENNEDCENRLKEARQKHKRETDKKTFEYETTIQRLRDALKEESKKVDELRGRLEECRTSKHETLTEMSQVRIHYGDRIKELEGYIAEGREELQRLQNKREPSMMEALKSEIDTMKERITSKDEEISRIKSINVDMKAEKKQLEDEKKTLQTNVNALTLDKETLSKTIKQSSDKINESSEELGKRDRQIKHLEDHIALLKKTTQVLDSQLVRFDGLLDEKITELEKTKSMVDLLNRENEEIREELRKCRVELNETKSLNIYNEKCLQKAHCASKDQTAMMDTEIASYAEQLQLANKRNGELSEQVAALTNQLSSVESEKFELKKVHEMDKSEKERYTRETHALLKSIVDVKDANVKLETELDKMHEENKIYRYELKSQNAKIIELEESIKYKELLFETTSKQQNKLIDHLNEQLHTLQEKIDKKKKSSIFTPKRHEKERPAMLLSTPRAPRRVAETLPKASAVSRGPQTPQFSTPFNARKEHSSPMKCGSLEEEEWEVRRLEEAKENLKSQLQNLKKNGTPVIRKAQTLPAPKKEECVLLKDTTNSMSDSDVSVPPPLEENDKAHINNDINLIGHFLLQDTQSHRIYVNCIAMLSSASRFVLGCDDGLYSLKEMGEKPVKIEGPISVYNIEILGPQGIGVLIEGSTRIISTVDLRLFKSCALAVQCSAPKLTTEAVPRTGDCYNLCSRGTTIKDTYVAAASGTKVLVYKIAEDTGKTLTVLREISVKESVTSLFLTPYSVLFANCDIYEADLRTFQIEEFLDISEDKIYLLKNLYKNFGSYPVAILDVTESSGERDDDPEYLICFQDIGVFVDSFGRPTRDGDLLWSQVPMFVEYRHPYLYIFHSTNIEIKRLDQNSCRKIVHLNKGEGKKDRTVETRIETPVSRFYPLKSKAVPKFVGHGDKGVVFVLNETSVSKVIQLNAH